MQMGYDLADRKMILATCALVVSMAWDIALDIVKDHCKVPSWIPGNLFVLNALTITILGYVDIEKWDAFSPTSEQLEVLFDSQLRMDAARLTICVFVGCTLPGIAMAGTEQGWNNIAALFVGLSFHIATEIYALQNANNSKVQTEAGSWFLPSGVLLLIGASSLLVLLGAVMQTTRIGRRLVRYDICEIPFKYEDNERETLRRKVLKSWAVVRFWKTECFACNSAFSPGAAMIVTICIIVMVAKLKCRSSLLHQNNGGGNLTFYLQCIFIFMGWILMLCRWFKAALYCGSSFNKEFIKHIKGSFLAPIIAVEFLILLPPICVLILAVSFLWWFCFICWYMSALFGSALFRSKFVRRLCGFDKETVSEKDEYSIDGWIMDGIQINEMEKNFFWMVNRRSLYRIRRTMKEASQIEQNYRGLLSIMEENRVAENQRLRLQDHNTQDWMGAVSAIFSAIADSEIAVDMKDSLAAYKETQDVLKFVDCPDNVFLDPLNIFGTMNFDSFFKSLRYETKMYDVERKVEQVLDTTLAKKKQTVKRARVDELVINLNRLGETFFNRGFDVRLGELNIEDLNVDECSLEELSDILRKLVGHVVVSGLLEASDVLLSCTNKWALNLDEAKMERGIELCGKVSGLLEKLVEDGEGMSQSRAKASEGDDVEASSGR